LTLSRDRLCTREQTRAAGGSIINQLGKELIVLSTVIIVLLVLWLLGVATSYTLGGLIHVLLVVAIVVVLLRVIQGRNPLRG
jgi:predicted ferric reductase